MHSFLRQKIITDISDDIEDIIKYKIPANYIDNLNSDFKGIIIPISRIRNQLYINRIDYSVRKIIKDGYLNTYKYKIYAAKRFGQD